MDYSDLEMALGYKFKDISLLETAFTHTTYVFENGGEHYESNQRLEFIGDAVMDVVVGRLLYDLKPMAGEGYLTKMRATVVCEQSFAEVARTLELGRYLKLGKGEAQSGGADKASSLADCFESVVAAVYFDGGFDAAFEVVEKNLSETIKKAINGEIFLDYKSRLLEIAQIRGNQHNITFKILDERGPAHNLEFECAVYADDIFLAKACGHSKKEAEQLCAKEGISKYSEIFNG